MRTKQLTMQMQPTAKNASADLRRWARRFASNPSGRGWPHPLVGFNQLNLGANGAILMKLVGVLHEGGKTVIKFWNWLTANVEWIFSGVGVVLLGYLFRFFSKRRAAKASGTPSSQSEATQIITHGKQSPGQVQGDYIVQESKTTKD